MNKVSSITCFKLLQKRTGCRNRCQIFRQSPNERLTPASVAGVATRGPGGRHVSPNSSVYRDAFFPWRMRPLFLRRWLLQLRGLHIAGTFVLQRWHLLQRRQHVLLGAALLPASTALLPTGSTLLLGASLLPTGPALLREPSLARS